MAEPRCVWFIEPRHGFSPEECEDAAAADARRGRFAIADGAGESSNAGPWARLLAETFVREETQPWPGWITPLQARWAEATRPSPGEPQPWFMDGRIEQGAFSTFVGLCVGVETWHAVAVGDSCLVHMSKDDMTPFPLTHSSQFGNSPLLIGSRQPVEGVPLRQARQGMGTWQPGDRLWLMTDALAKWFLHRAEEGGKPWRDFERLAGCVPEAFAGWVSRLRSTRELRDDDTTLLGVLL